MGSEGDWATMKHCDEQLKRLGIETRVEVMSAHRGPDRVREFAESAGGEGYEVIVAAAGMAAALAGTIAAHTSIPVIGVPMATGPLQGIDALISTVQMPAGVPVATVGLGEAGAVNAAVLAAQIVAVRDQSVAASVREYKSYLARNVAVGNRALQDHLRQPQRAPQAAPPVAKSQPSIPREERVTARSSETPAVRPERLKGAMSISVGHSVPEMGATDSSETADLERLAELASNMSEDDVRALQDLVKKLGKKSEE